MCIYKHIHFLIVVIFAFLLFHSEDAIKAQLKNKQSKGVMLDPKETYRGAPYYFGIDPVSAADFFLASGNYLYLILDLIYSLTDKCCILA